MDEVFATRVRELYAFVDQASSMALIDRLVAARAHLLALYAAGALRALHWAICRVRGHA